MNLKNIALLCAAVVVLSAAACNKNPQSGGQAAAPEAAPAAPAPAPEVYKVKFDTTKGDVVIEVRRSWAPHGADRFYELVKSGYFTDVAFFRAISGFMVQFGIHGDPAMNAKWHNANIPDDPAAGQSNHRGYVTFATAGPNTRTTQIFINYGGNERLDGMGFTPFGQVVDGMAVVDSFYQGYGEGAPMGGGPDQGRIQNEGNAYLKASFPKLDYIKSAKVE
jgi:peptidyl-prolyl cis-trans isomerase A (cyclophilin A)